MFELTWEAFFGFAGNATYRLEYIMTLQISSDNLLLGHEPGTCNAANDVITKRY